jgi:ribonucleoside-diphosphate reductase subunit M2
LFFCFFVFLFFDSERTTFIIHIIIRWSVEDNKQRTTEGQQAQRQSKNKQTKKMEEKEEEIDLLKDTPSRHVLFPIRHQKIWKLAKAAEGSMWHAQEVTGLADDVRHWNVMEPKTQNFIKMVLAFFAASDGIVGENLALRFYNDVKLAEARHFYGFQIAIEHVHSEVYSELIATYISDPKERTALLNAVENFPCVKRKADWALKWIDSEKSFLVRLVAFACVEGIFFSASFAAIYYVCKGGKLPALLFSNRLISRDEGGHCEFACFLFRVQLGDKAKQDAIKKIRDIIQEAFEIELQFIKDILPAGGLPGMNINLLTAYVQKTANKLCANLDQPLLFPDAEKEDPFPFIRMLAMTGHANFFETNEANYQKPGVAAGASGRAAVEIPEEAFHPVLTDLLPD